MRFEDGRLLLLSLALLPGCVGRKQGTDDDDNAPQRKLGDGCKAAAGSYMGCYDYEEYESGGYEGYDLEEYCDEITRYATEQFGEACARAQDDMFACIGALDCEQLQTVEDPFDACPDELANAHTSCPALFPTCDCGEWASSDNTCGLDCWECMDGQRYALSCTGPTQPGGLSTCSCVVGDTMGAAFEVADPCTNLTALAQQHCGVPE